MQCRLRALFTCAEFLDGSELECFTYDTALKRLACNHALTNFHSILGNFTLSFPFRFVHIPADHDDGCEEEKPGYPEPLPSSSETSLSETTREGVIERESRRRNRVLVVKPFQVVVCVIFLKF